MSNIIEILETIGGFIGIFAIIIVIWDHFKDDRLLTKEVQGFYDSIENFLASFIKITQNQSSEDKEIYSILLFEFEYYKRLVKSGFAEYSKYLGLTLGKSHDRRYKDDDAYITKSGNILVENGNLLNTDPEMLDSYERHAIGYARVLKKREIPEIDNFFADLRRHWKIFYHKTFFRPKLRKKIDFNEFVVV